MLPGPLHLELRAEHLNQWEGLSPRDEGETGAPPSSRKAGGTGNSIPLPALSHLPHS